VLVLGASGGVGSYAVQLAKAFGAEVTGVCSAAKADLVRSIGADHVIDYRVDDFADGTRQYDLILDLAGNPPLRRLRRALSSRGTVVFVGGEDSGAILGMGRQLRGVLLSAFIPQRLALLPTRERASDYDRLAELVKGGSARSEHRPQLPARGRTPRRTPARAGARPRQGRRHHRPVTEEEAR
jgi:NADPH:quinone reductase-like Zn-dependent oxidoreductase